MATYNVSNFINDPSEGDRLMFIYNALGQLTMSVDPYASTFMKKSKYVYIITDGKMNYDNVLDFSSESEADQAVARLNDVKKIFIDRTNNILNNCGGVVTIAEFDSHTANTNLHITENERATLNEANNPSPSNPFATILDIDIIASGDTKQVKVSGGDDTSGYLSDKITGSTYILLDVLNNNSAETLQISAVNLTPLVSFYEHTGNTQHLTSEWYDAFVNSNSAATASNPIATIADIQAGTSGLSIATGDARYVRKSGDTMIGNLNMSADIIPTSDGVRSLGSTTYQWKELWVSGGTIYLDRIPLTTDGTNLLFNGSYIYGISSLSELTDTTINNLQEEQILIYSGGTWVNSENNAVTDLSAYYTSAQTDINFLSASTTIDDLDGYTRSESDSNYLSANTNLDFSSNFLSASTSIGDLGGYTTIEIDNNFLSANTNLDFSDDFLSANTFNNQVNYNINTTGNITAVTYYGDGSNLSGVVSTLSALTDTTINNPTQDQILVYSGGTWVNSENNANLSAYFTSAQTIDNFLSANTNLDFSSNFLSASTTIGDLDGYTRSESDNNFLSANTGFYDLVNTAHTHLKSDISDFVESEYVHISGDESIDGNKKFTENVTINGDLFVSGTATTIYTEELAVKDNLIIINSGETNSGVTKGYAGIEIDRGEYTNYVFLFDETQDNFRIGESGTPTGGTQAVATREDFPNDIAIAFWNDSQNRFDTDSNITWNGTNLNIQGSISATTIYADIVGDVDWSSITNTPTTISGYGITDVYTKSETNSNFLSASTNLDFSSNFLSASTTIGDLDGYTKSESDSNYLSANTNLDFSSDFLSANTSFYTQTEVNTNFLSADTSLFDGSYTSLTDVPDFDSMYLSANTSFYTQTEVNANFLSANTNLDFSGDFLSANTSYYTQDEVNTGFLSALTNLNDLFDVDTGGTLQGYYLSYSAGTWVGVQDSTDLSNYYNKQESDDNFLSANTSFYTQDEVNNNFLSANTNLDFSSNYLSASTTIGDLDGYTKTESDNNFLSANTNLDFSGDYLSASTIIGDLDGYTKSESDSNYLSANTNLDFSSDFLSANTNLDFSSNFLSANTSYYTQLDADANFLSANTNLDFSSNFLSANTSYFTQQEVINNFLSASTTISNLSGYTKIESDDRFVSISGDTMFGTLTIEGDNILTTESNTPTDYSYIRINRSRTGLTNILNGDVIGGIGFYGYGGGNYRINTYFLSEASVDFNSAPYLSTFKIYHRVDGYNSLAFKINTDAAITFNEQYTFPLLSGDTGQVLKLSGDSTLYWSDDDADLSNYYNKQEVYNTGETYTKSESDSNYLSANTNLDFSGDFLSANTSFYTQSEVNDNFLSANTSYYTQDEVNTGFLSASTTITDLDGYTKSQMDIRYVNVTGDTMTGTLEINPTSGYALKTYADAIIMGNLYVSGTTTTIHAENMAITDNLFLLNSGETGSGVTRGTAGFLVDRGTSSAVTLCFDEDTFTIRVGETTSSIEDNTIDLSNTIPLASYHEPRVQSALTFWNGISLESAPITIVGNDLVTNGLIDGVDISVLKTSFDSHTANTSNPHQTTYTDLENRFTYDGLSASTYVLDSFASTTTDGCHWHYVVRDGANVEAGTVIGVWDLDSSAVTHTQYSTDELGNISGVSFDVDINSGDVRLLVNIVSGFWNIKIRRLDI